MRHRLKAAGLRAAGLIAALALSGCREPAPPSAVGAASRQPHASGSVNPDARVTTYACADGTTVTAGYPDHETAIVSYGDHSYSLKLARSTSGARYTGYGVQWWTKGTHASVARLKAGEEIASAAGTDCTATGPPAEEAATRT